MWFFKRCYDILISIIGNFHCGVFNVLYVFILSSLILIKHNILTFYIVDYLVLLLHFGYKLCFGTLEAICTNTSLGGLNINFIHIRELYTPSKFLLNSIYLDYSNVSLSEWTVLSVLYFNYLHPEFIYWMQFFVLNAFQCFLVLWKTICKKSSIENKKLHLSELYVFH